MLKLASALLVATLTPFAATAAPHRAPPPSDAYGALRAEPYTATAPEPRQTFAPNWTIEPPNPSQSRSDSANGA